MKNLLPIVFTILVCLQASAQETYTKIGGSPTDAINGHVGVELYGLDVGFKNLSGAMLFSVGVTGRYPITDKIKAEGVVRMPLLRFDKNGFSFLADAGILYVLNSNETTDDVKVVLGYSEEDNFATNTRTATTEYVKINGLVSKTNYARAGAYLRNAAFDDTSEELTDFMVTNIFHKGVYIGLAKERQYFFQLQRKDNNEEEKFSAGSIFMFYADAMLLPVNVDLVQDTFGLGAGETRELSGLLGGRVGLKWYRNPYTRSQNFDRKIAFLRNSIFIMEAGVRPLEGLFFTGGFTYILHKF